MQTLDGTILNTALPAMAASLGESPLRMQAAVISYLLTVALLTPLSGWLADRFGPHRVFIVAIFPPGQTLFIPFVEHAEQVQDSPPIPDSNPASSFSHRFRKATVPSPENPA